MDERAQDRVWDVLVVGAGIAGSATALACAGRGLGVLCLERVRLEEAGARWVNGVHARAFDQARLARPLPPERLASGTPFHLVCHAGQERVVVEDHGMLEVDMRLLLGRLHAEASRAGAQFWPCVRLEGIELPKASGERGSPVTVRTSRGMVQARFVVDASGIRGAGILPTPGVAPQDICQAAQYVHHIKDEQAARGFFARHKVPMGHTLCLTGVAGGYSVLNLRAHDGQVAILTGALPAMGHPSGRQLHRSFVQENAWVGEALFGGSYAIPLRRPFDRLAQGPLALVGDAACQVFPAHGSGTAPALLAAPLLARAIARALHAPARAGEGLEDYGIQWQRRYGGLHAMYDLFRRFSQTLAPGDIAQMMRLGLLDAHSTRQGLRQELPSLSVGALPGRLLALGRAPRLAAHMARLLWRMARLRELYRRYPAHPHDLAPWSHAVAEVLGTAPDLWEGAL